MHLIHLFWQATSHDFTNHGKLMLWIETDFAIHQKGFYPFQLNEQSLSAWYQNNIQSQGSLVTTKVHLPCNKKGHPIPSPVIANLNEMTDRHVHTFKSFSLQAIEVNKPLQVLKDLSFLHCYFEEDFKLSDDTRFWIKMGEELGHLIKKDQYIPMLVAKKQKNKVTYVNKWQTCSAEYARRLKHAALCMPHSACLGTFSHFDAESALKHFSAVSLNHLIATTAYSQKIHKNFSHTLLEHSIDRKEISLPESVWKSWKLWANNLTYSQLGAPFTLCFRLNSATSDKEDDWNLELLIQSKSDPSFMLGLAQYWQDKKSQAAMFKKLFGASIERTLLIQLGYASRIYCLLEKVFESNMQANSIALSTEQAFQFLKEDAWALHACGYCIIVPSWWTSQGRMKAKIKLRGSKSASTRNSDTPSSYFNIDNLIEFDYRYALGEHEISAKEWNALIDSKSELIYFRGQWLELNLDEMKKMQKLIDSSQQDKKVGSIKDLLAMAADDNVYDVDLDNNINALLAQLKNKDKIKRCKQPKALAATLRPYQVRGLSWLSYLETLGMNPCLADDMGLGKTMQVIALLLARPKDSAALLIAPTSVVGNWLREINKFAPSLKATIHHGSKRRQGAEFADIHEHHDLIISSYGLLRRDQALFSQHHWSRLIIDEAQNIKNPQAAQTKTLLKIPSDSRIALTGTPVENRLLDLWSIFNFLNPGFLGTRQVFKKAFEIPVQRDNCPLKTTTLKNLVEPFILRRLKSDKNIIHDLPDKLEQKVYCQLSKEQASLYQSIVEDVKDKLSRAEDNKHAHIILSSLLRLKQCCNHPAQVLQDNSEFSIERSMKLQRLTEMVKEVIDNGESVLIFSQFKEVCDAINKLLMTHFGYTTFYLHGATPRKRREEMIEQFQTSSTASIFVLSLKAGGVGITLTKANHVIHFDRWWNPAIENQATDRAYRIGQQKTVFAHKFITMGTIEERIDAMLEDKQKMADTIVGNDESWLSKLDSKSFIDLIKLSQSSVELQE